MKKIHDTYQYFCECGNCPFQWSDSIVEHMLCDLPHT